MKFVKLLKNNKKIILICLALGPKIGQVLKMAIFVEKSKLQTLFSKEGQYLTIWNVIEQASP
jgi:hypothetical protein